MSARRKRVRGNDESIPGWGWWVIGAFLFLVIGIVVFLTGFHKDMARACVMLAGIVESLGVVTGLALLYFVPTALASKSPRVAAIAVANIFFGWTIIGWVVVLIWALAETGSIKKK